MDKQAITTITRAADLLDRLAPDYQPDDTEQRMTATAQALRDLLPKPRFYAAGRNVWEQKDSGAVELVYSVSSHRVPDDATAHDIAQDIAASYNQRLGEVES